MSNFVDGGGAYTISAANVAALDGKTLLIGAGTGIVTIADDPATLGEREFVIAKDNETSQPTRIDFPVNHPCQGHSFVGLIGYTESVRIASAQAFGFKVTGWGNAIPGREFHRTFVPTSATQVYKSAWWCRNGIVRVNCDVNHLGAMVVLPDPANLGFVAPSYGRSFRVKIARPDIGSALPCNVFATLGSSINNRPQSVPTTLLGGDIYEFDFDNSQWFAMKGVYA